MLALLDSNGDIVLDSDGDWLDSAGDWLDSDGDWLDSDGDCLDSDGDWLDSDGGWVAINPPSPQRKARAVEVPRTHLEPSLWHSSTLLSLPSQTRLNSLSEPERNPNLHTHSRINCQMATEY